MKAIWNGQVIAESDDTVVVEGNRHFPPESVRISAALQHPYRLPLEGRGPPLQPRGKRADQPGCRPDYPSRLTDPRSHRFLEGLQGRA